MLAHTSYDRATLITAGLLGAHPSPRQDAIEPRGHSERPSSSIVVWSAVVHKPIRPIEAAESPDTGADGGWHDPRLNETPYLNLVSNESRLQKQEAPLR
jgi:hypothetical protein